MYRQYEPEQNENVQMQDQQQDMYEPMDFEDEQYMHGGGPMYFDPMFFEDDMYEYPMYDYEEDDMSRQMGGYGRPHQRRRRRRRRRMPYFFIYTPYFYHYPRPYYDYDEYDDDYEWD